MQRPLLSICLLTLAGCAAQPTPAPAQVDAKAQTCEREYRVGSTIPVLTCSGPKTEEERQQMLQDVRNQTRGVTMPGKGGG